MYFTGYALRERKFQIPNVVSFRMANPIKSSDTERSIRT